MLCRYAADEKNYLLLNRGQIGMTNAARQRLNETFVPQELAAEDVHFSKALVFLGRGSSMHDHFDVIGKKLPPPEGLDKAFEKDNGNFEREADE